MKDLILASVVHSIWCIWFCINQLRFNNHCNSIDQAFNLISASIFQSGRLSKGTMHPAIQEFKMLKFFNIEIHAPKALKIIQVDWHPPICGWIKVLDLLKEIQGTLLVVEIFGTVELQPWEVFCII